jgi:hypothetical protein
MSLKLHIVGDSNVDRYLPIVKACKEDPIIQDVSFVKATNLVQVKSALVPEKPETVYPAVVLACLTNPITNYAYEEYKEMIAHCNKTFSQIQAWVQEGRGALPGTMQQVFPIMTTRCCWCC